MCLLDTLHITMASAIVMVRSFRSCPLHELQFYSQQTLQYCFQIVKNIALQNQQQIRSLMIFNLQIILKQTPFFVLQHYSCKLTEMTNEQPVKFQLEEYYDILMSANIKEKLKPFLRQFKKKNIPFIYETIANTIQVITGIHEIPLMKFNALMATKLFFDTGQYVPIVLIEIYLLPIIFDIAFYRIQKRSEQGLTLYFTEKGGFDATKEIKRIGFNYVLLAIEFVFMSAQVKPLRCLQNQELKQDSNYAKVAKIIQDKGLKPIQNYKFYIPSYVNQTRKKYLKRLTKLNAQEYTDFFLKIICDELNLNKKPELDMKKMFVYGDAYITIPLMHICEDELTNMETNFVNKKKYLNLIGDFMKLGDIYAVLIITRSTFLENIFNSIQKVKGQNGFEAGEGIYPEIEASKADKKQLYIEYLKHIEIWATCHPVDEQGEPTDAKKIFQILKMQRKFVFPSNILINKVRNEMQQNLKLNKKRNQKLIKLVDEYSSDDSKRKINSSFRQSKISKRSEGLKVNSYIECDELQQMVIQAKKKLDLIIEKNNIQQTIKNLQKFKKFWETNAEKNEIQADQSADIQIVLEEGNLCLSLIDMVLPVYNLYAKGMISFEEYKDRVDLLMKKQAEQDQSIKEIEQSIRQVSFENNLPIKPQKSQSMQQFDDCYEKSSLSQLQSNVKPSKLSVHSSHRIQQQPSKNEQSHSNDYSVKKSVEPKSSIINQQVKEQSNISFRQQSINSSKSNLKKISQKESIQSESLLQQNSSQNKKGFLKHEPEQSYYDNQNKSEDIIFNQSITSFKNTQNSRSLRNNKKILERRNQSPAQSRSKLSREKESLISNGSLNYKDAIQKKYQRQNKDYYQAQQSFISSQNSIVQHIDKNKSQFNHQSRKNEQQIKISQEVSINSAYGNKIFVVNNSNEDYYGVQLSRNQKNKSNKSSRLRIVNRQNSQISQNKSRSKLSNKSKSYRGNNENISESIIEAYSGISDVKQQKKECKAVTKTNILNPMNNNFELLAKYEQEESAIHDPQFNPLLYSFHQEKSLQMTNPSKVSSFKQCFDVNNEIILAKEGKEKLLKFTKTGKITNFIQNNYPKQTPKNSTIVDIISQRNAKRSIQSYRNLREKSRATQTLSERMKSLQSFNKNMRMKIIIQNQQSKNQLPKTQDQLNHLKNSRKNNGSEPVSFFNQSQSLNQKSEANLKSETGEVASYFDLNQTRLINPKIYTHYFPINKPDKLKKCMLKSKSLLLKNEQFEIGCVTNRRDKHIQISLFVTPLKDSIEDVNLSIMNDRNINAKLFTQYIQKIKVNQQEYISIEFQVENVPYVIPTLNFKFKTNKHYSHNHMLISIPLAFNKFFTFHPINQESVYNSKSKTSRNDDFICTQEFKYSSKLINSDRIKQSLTNFGLIRKINKVSQYGCEAYFKSKIFLLKFIINQKGTMTLQGKNMTGDHKNTKFLQFLLITYRQIFESVKKQKQK